MKCLTVMQPWATLLVTGAKRFETRSWRTAYRGRVAIHAGRMFPEEARALCRQEPFRSALLLAGYRHPADLPVRAVLGTVELTDCLPAAEVGHLLPSGCAELRFGDFRPGRWVWRVRAPQPLARPLPLIGRLGLYEIPALIPELVAP